MMTRRSWLSHVLGPAALTGGLLAVNGASARSEAPEFVGIDGWLNADAPLKMAGLRGKAGLVEFGTYTCINWRRTSPYVSRWHSEYGPQGLQIICIHTPEFDFERNRPNVESAIRELRVDYPIAQDNEFRTWRAWDNRAWPAFYLVDGDGQVRLVREGEGNAQEIEGAIRSLLRLARTGAGSILATMQTCRALAHPRCISGRNIQRRRIARSRRGKGRQPTSSPRPGGLE